MLGLAPVVLKIDCVGESLFVVPCDRLAIWGTNKCQVTQLVKHNAQINAE